MFSSLASSFKLASTWHVQKRLSLSLSEAQECPLLAGNSSNKKQEQMTPACPCCMELLALQQDL
eukprot:4409315-Amphidinium_carterae.2